MIFIYFLISSILVFLAFIIYLNIKIGENIIESKKIIVENLNTKCKFNLNDYKDIKISTINKKTYYNDGGIFYLITSDENESSDGMSYLNICHDLCGGFDTFGNCVIRNDTYAKCIELLKPPSGCINQTQPVGKIDETLYYALSIKKN